METLKKQLFNSSIMTNLLSFYTQTLYTIFRIFAIIYGI